MKIFSGKKVFYLLPLALWLLGQVYVLLNPRLFFVALALGSLLIVLSTKGLATKSRYLDWPLFVYFPLIFFAASSLYETLIPNMYWVQALLLLNSGFIYIYFKNLYYFFRYEAPDRIDRLDTFLMAGSVLSVFFLAAASYGLPVFLGWGYWPLLGFFTLLTFPLFFQPFILGSLNLKINWPFFLTAILLFTQAAGVVYLFPFGFNILGLLTAIIFYILFLILRLFIRGRFSRQIIRFPLISSLIIVIILLLTTRWF
ncbi:MAG TPA: hypothetical protein VFD51_03255 [Patescibacteria group bacterium]|nr:hypothetical protein [Patescibacteria group bacterium]